MKPSKILVVVADRDLADSLGELLDARGFAAETADDALSALLAMTAFEPDVALLDIRLGRTGGLDLIGDLKRHRRDLVCIVITADAKADSVIEALRAGADDILRKPLDPAALFAAFERATAKLGLVRDELAAEDALRESEQRHRTLYLGNPVMQYSIDGEGRLREVNPFWLETLGYRREDVIGHGLWEFMTEDSARYMRESGLPRCLRAGEARNFAYRLVKKDGETIDVLHFAVEHRDAMGKFDHSLGFLIDVTEPKRAEDPLRESDARLAEATRIAGLGYAIWDAAADKCAYCSEAFARIHGLTPEAYIARASSLDGAFALTHPDDRESVRAAMKALGDGKGFEMEYRVITPDGETRHVHEIARPIFDAQGAVVQEYEVIQDITERKQAEEALRASEARLTQAQRIAKISHWVWDELEDRQTYTSDEADRIWGTPSGTLFAGFDSFLDIVHPDDRDHVDSVMEQAKQDRTGYEVEYRIIRRDGKQLHILEQADVELDERGNLLRTIGTIQDITERKQAEESLRASEARYREIFAVSPVGIWDED